MGARPARRAKDLGHRKTQGGMGQDKPPPPCRGQFPRQRGKDGPRGPAALGPAPARRLDPAQKVSGSGNGPIASFADALSRTALPAFTIQNYSEHSLGAGADARAVSYIEIRPADGRPTHGVGPATNLELAPIRAIVSALHRCS